MLKKLSHTFRPKILGQFLPYFINVISRYVDTLGFRGVICVADTVRTWCRRIPILIFVNSCYSSIPDKPLEIDP